MRAFLSHSSKDKGYVETVADLLRPGTFELDSATFDAGLLNSQNIIEALKRCDLFCLFLSEASLKSSYVEFETLLGIEFLASGRVGRFLAICLDENSFELASANIKFFNIVRKSLREESTARLIQGYLISAARAASAEGHPFTGREAELRELEDQITDHRRPTSKGIFISGNFGSGRRTLAQKFYEQRFPQVNRVFATITLDTFAGLDELYRKTLAALRPAMTTSELRTRVQAFDVATPKDKELLTAQLINSLLPAREAATVLDAGGLLTDAGQLMPELNSVVSLVEAIVNAHDPDERRTNYRSYLQTLSNYYVEIEKFSEAKEIYQDRLVFTDEEAEKARKKIEIVQGFRQSRSG